MSTKSEVIDLRTMIEQADAEHWALPMLNAALRQDESEAAATLAAVRNLLNLENA